jgi:hypothetical protein
LDNQRLITVARVYCILILWDMDVLGLWWKYLAVDLRKHLNAQT